MNVTTFYTMYETTNNEICINLIKTNLTLSENNTSGNFFNIK